MSFQSLHCNDTVTHTIASPRPITGCNNIEAFLEFICKELDVLSGVVDDDVARAAQVASDDLLIEAVSA